VRIAERRERAASPIQIQLSSLPTS
jgi:hypothetical protein